jgi:twitching motility protein PilT
LLSAIVRADGDALVMHVGERPYVVVGTLTINISTHALTLDAMTGMLSQLLTADALAQLDEFGAVEHHIPQDGADRFTCVAARGGDDIWIEIRRRREQVAVVEPFASPAITEPASEPTTMPTAAEPIAEAVVPEPVSIQEAEPVVEVVAAVPEPEPPPAPPVPEPFVEPVIEPAAETTPEMSAEPIAEATTSPMPEPIEEPIAPAIESPTPEPSVQPVMQPAAELTQPSIPEPIAAPVIEPHIEPVEPAPMPAAASIESDTRVTEPRVAQPMSRTVRIEVSPRTAAAVRSTSIERLLRLGASRGASALFLTPGSRPWVRVDGALRQLDGESPLSRAAVEGAILEIAPEGAQASIAKGEPTEWTTEFTDVGRVRCTTFVDQRGPGVLLRLIATRAATAEQLGLTREVQALATESQGVVLVVAPRGSGKSTLLSAMVDLVNRQRAEFVITLERQLRLTHDSKSAFISQREVRGGDDDAVSATRSALRENPDVLVIDDLVSAQMVPLLTTAAADGALVFITITAASTTDAVQRFVELAPAETRQAVQRALAESFRGAVAQVLLKKTAGGSIAAREVMLATAPVSRVIGEGQFGQLPLAIEGGGKHGMVSVNDTITEFVRSGTVDVREAFRKAPDRARLLDSLKRDGVDTSAVERLA